MGFRLFCGRLFLHECLCGYSLLRALVFFSHELVHEIGFQTLLFSCVNVYGLLTLVCLRQLYLIELRSARFLAFQVVADSFLGLA